jgi:hypothetical protein
MGAVAFPPFVALQCLVAAAAASRRRSYTRRSRPSCRHSRRVIIFARDEADVRALLGELRDIVAKLGFVDQSRVSFGKL